MVAIVAGVSYGFGGRKVAIVAMVAGVGEGVKFCRLLTGNGDTV